MDMFEDKYPKSSIVPDSIRSAAGTIESDLKTTTTSLQGVIDGIKPASTWTASAKAKLEEALGKLKNDVPNLITEALENARTVAGHVDTYQTNYDLAKTACANYNAAFAAESAATQEDPYTGTSSGTYLEEYNGYKGKCDDADEAIQAIVNKSG